MINWLVQNCNSFQVPENSLYLSCKCPTGDLLILVKMRENIGMDEMIERLEQIGFTNETCDRIKQRFAGDIDGLERYVVFCVALFDDRHEYVD